MLFLIRLTLSLIFFPALSANVSAQSDKLVCRVNGAVGWYPIFFKKEDKFTGIGIDVLRAFELKHDVKLVYGLEVPWIRLEHQLKTGELDILVGAYFKQERARHFVYSSSFLTEEITIFVSRSAAFELADINDLIGKQGIRPANGSYGESFDNFAQQNLEIHEIVGTETMLRMLMGKRADYVVLAKSHGLHLIREFNLKEKIMPLTHPVAENDIHFLFSKLSKCVSLIPKLNTFIKELKDTELWNSIYTRY